MQHKEAHSLCMDWMENYQGEHCYQGPCHLRVTDDLSKEGDSVRTSTKSLCFYLYIMTNVDHQAALGHVSLHHITPIDPL